MWLGGRYGADGSPVQSLDGLKAALDGLGFRLVKEQVRTPIPKPLARLG